jgi:hypothetical protein
MAEQLGIGQEGISRLEKRSDLMISTLRDYVEAMGGKLRFVAEFPARPPTTLTGRRSAHRRSPEGWSERDKPQARGVASLSEQRAWIRPVRSSP